MFILSQHSELTDLFFFLLVRLRYIFFKPFSTSLPVEGAVFICPCLPYCLILISKGKTISKLSNQIKKQELKKQVSEATTFSLLDDNLEEIIQWCSSERMKRTKRLLTFLRFKCQKMKCLEAAGHK